MAPTVEQVSYVCYLNSLIYSNIDVLSRFFSSVPKNLPIQNSVLTLVRVFIAIHKPLLLRVTSMKAKAGCNSNIAIYRTGLIFSFTDSWPCSYLCPTSCSCHFSFLSDVPILFLYLLVFLFLLLLFLLFLLLSLFLSLASVLVYISVLILFNYFLFLFMVFFHFLLYS